MLLKLSLMLLLLLPATNYSQFKEQVYPDEQRNTTVIRPNARFVNTDSITWFANPRDRQERFVFYAQSYDTIKAIITEERRINANLTWKLDIYKTLSIGVFGMLLGVAIAISIK